MITCKSEKELSYMRDAGRVVAETLAELTSAVRVGVTTRELDRLAEDYIIKAGAKPAFKGLYGFPYSICASVNEEVVHGFPSLRKLVSGDIISIDIGAEVNGYYGDSAVTVPVGEVSSDAMRLLKATEESLYKGIEHAREGARLSDISNAVQTCAEGYGYSVVRDYVGHGIGSSPHEDPQVPNFGKPGRGPRLKAGMTLAIEPMINMGTFEVRTLTNNWTVVTLDAKLSAHFEHTVAITDDKPEILTIL
ncbi:type I methionyl aminopeptidase [Pelotomaculum terephthalicicum JT]|uniref:type I methionyl aminopeptidase n=1 Tax=Pelotomaculum TaxID=191373 RepID=UPI0009CC2788|nr:MULTISPECIES: type I methionyl aminopeptidase [Pelotomaculum]MCG9967869.1 type I methionyl aminopeptidase [Pelotomaculum terephthalicicum JT]OPX91000.1 MAG: Methionine aminopeptidase 1 [Pelotomaculum sp. PtaB.Bin117]OPY61445.1 MAG: Methionine aminopeptidase 1 [Pelotomaculum sp. PtaU1.Bin065]